MEISVVIAVYRNEGTISATYEKIAAIFSDRLAGDLPGGRRHSDHRRRAGRKHLGKDFDAVGCDLAARALPPATKHAAGLLRRRRSLEPGARRPDWQLDVELRFPL